MWKPKNLSRHLIGWVGVWLGKYLFSLDGVCLDSFSGNNMVKVHELSKEGALGWLEFESSFLKLLENFLQVAKVVLEIFPKVMTSSMRTMQWDYWSPSMVRSINLQKVAGALLRQNGIMLNWNNPWVVQNTCCLVPVNLINLHLPVATKKIQFVEPLWTL